MTQLQLVEVDARKEQITRKVKAVSTSWSTLKKYCEDTFGQTPNGDGSTADWYVTYEIEESDIVIVRENTSKFDK